MLYAHFIAMFFTYKAHFTRFSYYDALFELDVLDPPQKKIKMYIFSTAVKFVEETYLVTFNGFVSSFGGSLGLFLGFSCFLH
jgi:hypothetical protein